MKSGLAVANQSLNTTPENPPHGIMGLVEYSQLLNYLLIIAAILLTASIFCFCWFKYRSKHKNLKSNQKIEDPFKVLKDRFKLLEIPKPFTRSKAKEFYFELDLILRGYIELTSVIKATGMTIREIKRPLRTYSSLSNSTVDDLLKFLNYSALVKYANKTTSKSETEKNHQKAQEWINFMLQKHSNKTAS